MRYINVSLFILFMFQSLSAFAAVEKLQMTCIHNGNKYIVIWYDDGNPKHWSVKSSGGPYGKLISEGGAEKYGMGETNKKNVRFNAYFDSPNARVEYYSSGSSGNKKVLDVDKCQ